MDLTLNTDMGKFNHRVAGVIIHENKLLFQKSDTYYLPGGRVHFGESTEDAIRREIKEELKFEIKNFRPLWVNEVFFVDSGTRFHEIAMYYLIDITDCDFNFFDEEFTLSEENRTNTFRWLSIDDLKNHPVYPIFLRDEVKCINDSLKLIITDELN